VTGTSPRTDSKTGINSDLRALVVDRMPGILETKEGRRKTRIGITTFRLRVKPNVDLSG
jgi:hypothetical protein